MAAKKSKLGLLELLNKVLIIKTASSRKKTAQDYQSHLQRFETYLKKQKRAKIKAQSFSKQDAIAYLDHILINRGVGAQTRNNYMRVMRVLFNMLVEREYIIKNPFASIKCLKPAQKRRKTFSKAEKLTIAKYIKSKDEQLFLAVCLCYYCALRPSELRRLRIEDINLRIGLITMDGSRTKNKENAQITIPEILLPFLKSLHLNTYPQTYFVFGALTMKPRSTPCGRDTISKKHQKAIKELEENKFIKNIEGKTFYSWKDTAARDLIGDKLTILEVKQHFRHKDITTTQKYMQEFSGINKAIRDNKNSLFL